MGLLAAEEGLEGGKGPVTSCDSSVCMMSLIYVLTELPENKGRQIRKSQSL